MIHGNTHLDQRDRQGKRLLKMSFNFGDDQPKRVSKSVTTSKSPQSKANQAKQSSEAKKSSEKARKEKKKKNRQE